VTPAYMSNLELEEALQKERNSRFTVERQLVLCENECSQLRDIVAAERTTTLAMSQIAKECDQLRMGKKALVAERAQLKDALEKEKASRARAEETFKHAKEAAEEAIETARTSNAELVELREVLSAERARAKLIQRVAVEHEELSDGKRVMTKEMAEFRDQLALAMDKAAVLESELEAAKREIVSYEDIIQGERSLAAEMRLPGDNPDVSSDRIHHKNTDVDNECAALRGELKQMEDQQQEQLHNHEAMLAHRSMKFLNELEQAKKSRSEFECELSSQQVAHELEVAAVREQQSLGSSGSRPLVPTMHEKELMAEVAQLKAQRDTLRELLWEADAQSGMLASSLPDGPTRALAALLKSHIQQDSNKLRNVSVELPPNLLAETQALFDGIESKPLRRSTDDSVLSTSDNSAALLAKRPPFRHGHGGCSPRTVNMSDSTSQGESILLGTSNESSFCPVQRAAGPSGSTGNRGRSVSSPSFPGPDLSSPHEICMAYDGADALARSVQSTSPVRMVSSCSQPTRIVVAPPQLLLHQAQAPPSARSLSPTPTAPITRGISAPNSARGAAPVRVATVASPAGALTPQATFGSARAPPAVMVGRHSSSPPTRVPRSAQSPPSSAKIVPPQLSSPASSTKVPPPSSSSSNRATPRGQRVKTPSSARTSSAMRVRGGTTSYTLPAHTRTASPPPTTIKAETLPKVAPAPAVFSGVTLFQQGSAAASPSPPRHRPGASPITPPPHRSR